MISPPSASAKVIARSDFPEPVGPRTAMSGEDRQGNGQAKKKIDGSFTNRSNVAQAARTGTLGAILMATWPEPNWLGATPGNS